MFSTDDQYWRIVANPSLWYGETATGVTRGPQIQEQTGATAGRLDGETREAHSHRLVTHTRHRAHMKQPVQPGPLKSGVDTVTTTSTALDVAMIALMRGLEVRVTLKACWKFWRLPLVVKCWPGKVCGDKITQPDTQDKLLYSRLYSLCTIRCV